MTAGLCSERARRGAECDLTLAAVRPPEFSPFASGSRTWALSPPGLPSKPSALWPIDITEEGGNGVTGPLFFYPILAQMFPLSTFHLNQKQPPDVSGQKPNAGDALSRPHLAQTPPAFGEILFISTSLRVP